MFRRMSASLLMSLLIGMLAVAAPSTTLAQAGERCFAETGFCISGPIRTFWERNGGLPVFGLPLGPQQEETIEGRQLQVQRFERNRLELHPENPAPYTVLIGRVGVERLEQLGRPWQRGTASDASGAGDAENCRLFAETGYTVCGEFLAAFRRFGLDLGRRGIQFEESLALFGLPVSEARTETIEGREYTVQWFERARFELHPENQPPFNVLFGRLGAELGGGSTPRGDASLTRGPWQLVSFGAVNAPQPAVDGTAATLTFDGTRAAGSTGCNNFTGDYQAGVDTITFGVLASTLALCTEDAVAAQEQAILGALQGTVPYSISGGQLRISYDGNRQALTYRAIAAPTLEGGEWKLTYFGSTTNPQPAVAESAATLAFDGSRVTGSTGCNRLNGGYTTSGGTIAFGPIATTLALCTSDALTAQERAILSALDGSVPYSIVDGKLRIEYGGGAETLLFER
jgi:heat shock protein HslJ